jgi:hypothetical protein
MLVGEHVHTFGCVDPLIYLPPNNFTRFGFPNFLTRIVSDEIIPETIRVHQIRYIYLRFYVTSLIKWTDIILID